MDGLLLQHSVGRFYQAVLLKTTFQFCVEMFPILMPRRDLSKRVKKVIHVMVMLY